jgi:nitroreductase
VARPHARQRPQLPFFGSGRPDFTIDRNLESGSWLDYGMFLQNVMVAARARGLDTCAQASFLKFHRVIEHELSLPANESVICAMSLGHADPDAPENRLVTERAPVAARSIHRIRRIPAGNGRARNAGGRQPGDSAPIADSRNGDP